ncbi:hypothetical protein EJV47_11140 [Hymenobacter gummosus]|uniref:Lipoprotein n=1 Tax=Hymenobacter gummosus TaxID=1776032 RepID=A0A3S0K5Y8_9BACT|nr:hypothetical protein [Hymenobacter gummosus]RTQ50181.1 hypothetical protein EJV47_11140 [Hymenobacter gummosus]
MTLHLLRGLSLLALLTTACGSEKQPEVKATPPPASAATALRQDSVRQGSPATNDELSHELQLQPIRANFQSLNARKQWSRVVKRELSRSTEGGEAVFYYEGAVPVKIVARDYGETGQWLTEYYLLDGQLSFVYEQKTSYNRPFYYDSATARQNGGPAFDPAQSTVEETRSYFADGQLIRQLRGKGVEPKPASEMLPLEQKRLLTDYNELLSILHAPD